MQAEKEALLMAYLKRAPSTRPLDADKAVAALKTFAATRDFGSGISADALDASRGTVTTHINAQNNHLIAADTEKDAADAAEKSYLAAVALMRKAVGLHYGYDSAEYQAVGGTRTSERKRPTRKAPSA